MRFSQVVAASMVAPLAAAHGAGMEGMPRIFGMPKQMRASNPFAGYKARHAAHPALAVGPRQEAGRCGPQNGNQVCASNECCSSAGYCGTTKEHCQAPDCLFNFGPACDANKTPAGASTRNVPRPKLGKIPYGGGGIYVCNNPGTVAITYDDGPYIYTENVMRQFEARGGHATFFITGNNIGKGSIDENWAGVIKQMYDNGHQVASHTWSHQDLSAITKEEAYDQMVKNEMALRNILGRFPTYMRPPYSSCNAVCQEVMADLGYVVSYFDLDTDDYNNLTPEKIQVAKDNFKNGIDTRNSGDPYDGDRLAIGHDIHQLTAENLTAYMLDYVYSQGLRAVTMGECLQDPKENWYRESTPAPPSTSSTRTSSSIPTPTGPTSKDGMCGATGANQSCIGFVGGDGLLGECCSQHGWCGRTSDHCQTGCQAGFGKCGAQPSASPSASATVTASVTGPVPTPTGPTTTDGSCGAKNNGMTCIGFVGPDGLSECCSEYGYCGNTDAYCSAGCQAGFGKCGKQDIKSSSASASASASSVSVAPSASKDAVSASSQAPNTPTASVSASSQAPNTPTASVSASSQAPNTPTASVSATSEAPHTPTASVSASSQAPNTPTASVSASASGYVSGSASASVSSQASPSASASVSISKPDGYGSVSASASASSSGVYPSSAPSSASKDSYPTESVSSMSSGSASMTPSPTPASSSFSTAIVRPSSTSCTTSATATPTELPVSQDGKCGDSNGGQTCAGYKTPWGIQMGCCCKQSGRCSIDPWACTAGCDKKYGKCWV